MNRPYSQDPVSGAPAMRRAFTLKELAATVVLLSIWGVWLIPTAAGVRQSSKKERCLTNLGRIGFADSVYAANDPNEMALPVNWRQNCQCAGQACGEPCDQPLYIGAYEWGGKSGVGHPGDPYAVEAGAPTTGEDAWMSSKFGTAAGAGPGQRPLNAILYNRPFENHRFDPDHWDEDTRLELDANRCPSDTGYTGIHHPSFADEHRTSYDHYGTSYNANVFSISYGTGTPMGSNSPYLHRMSDLLSPANTLAFMENNGRYAWAANPQPPECVPVGSEGFSTAVRGWHGKNWTFNAAFLDAHVETIYMRGFRNPRVFRPDDFVSQQVSKCVIIRGEGWQIDTMPVDLVATGVLHTGDGRASFEGGLQ